MTTDGVRKKVWKNKATSQNKEKLKMSRYKALNHVDDDQIEVGNKDFVSKTREVNPIPMHDSRSRSHKRRGKDVVIDGNLINSNYSPNSNLAQSNKVGPGKEAKMHPIVKMAD